VIELSMNDFIELYKLASIGKLVGGLIHNLNGPLQNLGLDLEMAHLSLKKESKWDNSSPKDIIIRLQRMEEEHERINSLIRSTAAKAEDNADLDNTLLNLYEFLKKELDYLHTNLYFKHNVHTEILINNTPPLTSELNKDSLMALGWFLQVIVEELEKQKIKGLRLGIISDNSNLQIKIETQGGKVSANFIGQIKEAMSSSGIIKSDNKNLGIFIVLLIFKSNGITFEFEPNSSCSNMIINFPMLNH